MGSQSFYVNVSLCSSETLYLCPNREIFRLHSRKTPSQWHQLCIENPGCALRCNVTEGVHKQIAVNQLRPIGVVVALPHQSFVSQRYGINT